MPKTPQTKYTSQNILNNSYNEELESLVVVPAGYDGSEEAKLVLSDSLAMKVTVVGAVTYVALAAPGSVQSDAVWQVKRIDETTGTVITFADGDAEFNNVASDLTALDYS